MNSYHKQTNVSLHGLKCENLWLTQWEWEQTNRQHFKSLFKWNEKLIHAFSLSLTSSYGGCCWWWWWWRWCRSHFAISFSRIFIVFQFWIKLNINSGSVKTTSNKKQKKANTFKGDCRMKYKRIFHITQTFPFYTLLFASCSLVHFCCCWCFSLFRILTPSFFASLSFRRALNILYLIPFHLNNFLKYHPLVRAFVLLDTD